MRCRGVPRQHQGRDELVPAASHVMEQYMNNPIEADHGRLKIPTLNVLAAPSVHSGTRLLAAHAAELSSVLQTQTSFTHLQRDERSWARSLTRGHVSSC